MVLQVLDNHSSVAPLHLSTAAAMVKAGIVVGPGI